MLPSPLLALDDAVFELQRLTRKPGYQAKLLGKLSAPVEFSTVRVLRAVQRVAKQPPSVGDIAERMLVDPSTASRLVDQQVAAGYLLRQRHPDDGRRSQLLLTDEGRALLREVTAARREILGELTAAWSSDDIELLSDLLHRLSQDIQHLESSA